MAAILTTKEDAQGVEENIDPNNFYLGQVWVRLGQVWVRFGLGLGQVDYW